jgi:hypothetical protein
MARNPDEDADVTLIERLVFSKRGLALERYSRLETLAAVLQTLRCCRTGPLWRFAR